jgi:hypothetical protein
MTGLGAGGLAGWISQWRSRMLTASRPAEASVVRRRPRMRSRRRLAGAPVERRHLKPVT